jgi:uncharacterized protein
VPTGLRLAWQGGELVLRPEGALHLPQQGALLIADFHLGKAHSFRRLGVPVPGGTTEHMLQRLDALLEQVRPSQLVFLGDFLHAATAQASPALARFAAWRAARPGLSLTLVRGNHDDRAGDPPTELAMAVVDEPWPLGPWALCHHPLPPGAASSAPQRPRIAGHWHPAAVLRGAARDHLRLPCFCLTDQQLVLPAFGAFTGMHTVAAAPGQRRYVSDGQRLHALPD